MRRELGFVLLVAAMYGQNAPSRVPSATGLINDPPAFYTTVLLDGQRALTAVRFQNFGTAVKVTTDPLLKRGDPARVQSLGLRRFGVDPNLLGPLPYGVGSWNASDNRTPNDGPIYDTTSLLDRLRFSIETQYWLGGGAFGGPVETRKTKDPESRYAVLPESDEAPWDPPTRGMPLIAIDYDANAIQRWNPERSQVLRTIFVDAGPTDVMFAPDGTLYVLNSISSTISVIRNDAVARKIALPSNLIPRFSVISRDGTRAYIAADKGSGSTGALVTVDLVAGSVLGNIEVGNFVGGVALTPDESQLWVTSAFGDNVTIVDVATFKPISQILNIRQARGLAFSPDVRRAYVASGADFALYVIDTKTWSTVAKILIGNDPRSVKVSPSGRHVFVTNFGADTISQIDTSTNTVIRTITVGEAPLDIDFINVR